MNPKTKITRRTLLISLLILIITLIIPFFLSCECECAFLGEGRLFDLLIENKTETKLLIFINDYEEGYVSPNETISKRTGDVGEFTFKAKNIQGDVVFSKTY